MKISRRQLSFLLPALAATGANAQRTALPSQVFRYSDLTARPRENKANTSRSYFDGATHTGFKVRMHETTLAPGLRPHEPHRHAHEELVILREGTLEVTIEGETRVMTEPGSAAFIASNDEHASKNPGTTPARYFVVAMG
jgi:quercetin dioxygenase-like cupin family protein